MAAHQASPSLGFSRQEHWSGLPFPSPMRESEKWKWSCSVVSDPQQPHGLQPSRLLRPWDFPGKSTGVGCRCLLQSSCMYFLSPSSQYENHIFYYQGNILIIFPKYYILIKKFLTILLRIVSINVLIASLTHKHWLSLNFALRHALIVVWDAQLNKTRYFQSQSSKQSKTLNGTWMQVIWSSTIQVSWWFSR